MNEFETILCNPLAQTGLGFTFSKPASWQVLEIPAEPPQFDNPAFFLPLHVCMSPLAAIIHSVAARPAYDDGSVSQWMEWLCGQQGIAIESSRAVTIGASPAVECEGTQDSEAGPLRLRILFLEDGKRLFTVTCLAPAELWPTAEPIFAQMLGSFRLETVHGATAPLEQNLETQSPPTEAKDVAIAADASSLDPDNPMNARLRDGGIGLVPRVLATNEQERYAVVGAGAVESTFHIPFGWHVVDDGRRTLIFDPDGRMQINLNLRRMDGGVHDMLRDIEAEHERQQPGIPRVHFSAAGLECLAFRGLQVRDEILDQTFLVRESDWEGVALTARVTANQEDMPFAMNTAEVVLTSMQRG